MKVKKFHTVFILFFFISISSTLNAQKKNKIVSDSAIVTGEIEIPDTTKKHSVAKAALFSAVLPGLGQGYNRKWWKIPIVYAALGATGYFMIDNQIKQKRYKEEIKKRIADPSYVFENGYDSTAVLSLQRQHQSSRDLFIFITAGVYLLNVVDAAVDAQLFNFDVSRDLTMRWSPTFHFNTFGLGVQLKFKNRIPPKRNEFTPNIDQYFKN